MRLFKRTVPILGSVFFISLFFTYGAYAQQQESLSLHAAESYSAEEDDYLPGNGVETMQEEAMDTGYGFILLKNNVFQDIMLVFNAGVEFGIKEHMTVNVPLTFSPYTISDKWMLRTLSVQPEFRYWFKESRKGPFAGVHAHLGWYNVISCLFGKGTGTRFQDKNGNHPLSGGGLSAGYGWILDRNARWGVELTAGVGYAYLDYDKFYNVDNGALSGSGTKNYFGITNLGFSFSYKFGSEKDRRDGE